MSENAPRSSANLHKTPPHTAKSKIPENPGIPSFPGLFCKKTFVFKIKLLFFTIFHIKHNGFFTFLCFLHFRTRILTKNATFLAKSGQKASNSNDFGCQGASKHSKIPAFSIFMSANTIKSMVFDVLDPLAVLDPLGLLMKI